MSNSIADRGVAKKSDRLKGKRIGVAISGGIGAVEVVKIIRELRRHGAEVTPYFSSHAEEFITALSVEWAAGRPVIRKLGADVEHLDTHDMVVVAPATLNTISKCAVAISDNPVTMVVACQLGRRGKVLFIPAMNEQLQQHPAYLEHRKRLESWGSRFFESELDEGRMKMPAPEALVEEVIRLF